MKPSPRDKRRIVALSRPGIDDDDEPTTHGPMMLYEFVHAMLRLALEVVPSSARDAAAAAAAANVTTVKDRFEMFWTQLVLPKARFIDVEGFRDAFKGNRKLQMFLDQNYMHLRGVFVRYAGDSTAAVAAGVNIGGRKRRITSKMTVSFVELSRLLADAGVLSHEGVAEGEEDDCFFDKHDAAEVYVASHRRRPTAGDRPNSKNPTAGGLDFDEFKECVCRAADRAWSESDDDDHDGLQSGGGLVDDEDADRRERLAQRVKTLVSHILERL